ncbi:periplasmic heavy metal sensor [Sphingomonas sp. H39-1-10]|uniref:periplasmic heavy metal sensor n=1 Tax=Sphingomonas pollutisoli TaxID=3030829 RepID=UPI0023B92C60|nr:periplasmic heavy metal sensor [Sphingomonas pollutisoli]MDF0488438.1 periplasmic heavy metal sensor [Sphingomonas pollutisoli]
MSRGLWLVLTTALAFVAAIGGVGVGRLVWPGAAPPGAALHRLLHDRIHLDRMQGARIEALERHYAARREALEAEMRSDNARLAWAIKAEHGYGPRVAAAVNASHMAMGALQRETLAHVFAMRQVLRPDQAASFDAAIADKLTDPAR